MMGLPERLDVISGDTTPIIADFDAVVRNNSKIFLSWGSSNKEIEFFSLERSSNSREFEIIAVMKQAGGPAKIDWVDEQPSKGKNQYRIRCSAKDGTIFYSGIVTAHVTGNISFRFYPNPTDNMLIVRSEQTVDISILDANGKTRIVQTQFSGLQTLNVSTLEKGVYILNVFDRQQNTHIQDKLVKN